MPIHREIDALLTIERADVRLISVKSNCAADKKRASWPAFKNLRQGCPPKKKSQKGVNARRDRYFFQSLETHVRTP